MAVEYGVAITNKFGFMSDDEDYDDPRELIQKVSLLAAKKKEEKPAVKPAQPAKEAVTTSAAKTENTRGRGGRGRGRGGAGRPPRDGNDQDRFGENRRGGPRRGGERGAGRPARGGRGGFGGNTHNNNSNSANNTTDEVTKEVSFEEGVENNGRPRRRGGFSLGGSGGRGGGRGRGRQYDRQSGSDRTGVRSLEKKDGHGKGNWGDQKDELVGETENIAPEVEAEPETPREKTAEELAFEAEQAELAKQKTLKEFRAQQNADAPKFNTRKAGEGANDTFGKLIPMKKAVIPDREEEEVVVIRKEPKKQVLDISITFAENNRGGFRNNERNGDRPHRGGRGGRTGGGRGGARGGNNRNTPFDASAEAFPALGAQ
ncbi:unnamed protein product [Caenorhabditis angaria]|uniref:Hyaluronan/mRNA-binding protein domain-containing protein n=1 Tax=Caenorhabditis angaria TaxID=860376 RepID=A0A9P1MVR4_9PELO|nr:unnamed protein product [Caenorhabditis angaria]